MLKFRIQGSSKEPYTITAEGEGSDLVMFCSCPAGRKGGKFCKHVASILVGDVTNLIGSIDDVNELARRAKDSALISKALNHQSRTDPEPWAHIRTFEDLISEMGSDIEALGFELEVHKDTGDIPHRLPLEKLQLFSYFKNGKRRKTPTHAIYFEPLTGDTVLEPGDADFKYQNIKPRVRPWVFDSRAVSSLAKLVPKFRKKIGLES